jgi:biopolymer transport protein ExbB
MNRLPGWWLNVQPEWGQVMPEGFGFLLRLLALGGPVVAAVLLLSTWMWWLLAERYWFLHRHFPGLREQIAGDWARQRPQARQARVRLRQARLERLSRTLSRHFGTIRALTAVLPLLGLLGTVTGMITTFDHMTLAGQANPRELSRGIDGALISTIAGLVTALSGLYTGTLLEARAQREQERLAALFG